MTRCARSDRRKSGAGRCGQLIVPKKLHDLADDAGSVPLALPVAQLASAGSHTVFLSAECSNAPSPCHAAGTAACVDIQTEATAPAFSFGCHCREGWANGVCADGSIPEVAHLCNVTLEGRCEVDVEECARVSRVLITKIMF